MEVFLENLRAIDGGFLSLSLGVDMGHLRMAAGHPDTYDPAPVRESSEIRGPWGETDTHRMVKY